jgi:hypothetical protein
MDACLIPTYLPLAIIGKPKMPSLTLVVVLLLLIFSYNVDGDDEHQESCSRRCGVHNISHPFRLKDSPEKCGDKRYILSCEDNNQLILYYEFEEYHGKYYVQSINYNNFTIRLLDFNLASSNNSIPRYFSLGIYNFSSYYDSPYLTYYQYKNRIDHRLTKSILYVSCPNCTDQHSYVVDEGANCLSNSSYSQYENSFYVDGYGKTLSELGLRDGCRIEFMFLTSWSLEDGNNNNISCMDIDRMMSYGFEVSWVNSLCKDGWHVELDQHNNTQCRPPCNLLQTTSLIIF